MTSGHPSLYRSQHRAVVEIFPRALTFSHLARSLVWSPNPRGPNLHPSSFQVTSKLPKSRQFGLMGCLGCSTKQPDEKYMLAISKKYLQKQDVPDEVKLGDERGRNWSSWDKAWTGGKDWGTLSGEFLRPWSALTTNPTFLSDPGIHGPIYGSWYLLLTVVNTLCRLKSCNSGWWRQRLNTNWWCQ